MATIRQFFSRPRSWIWLIIIIAMVALATAALWPKSAAPSRTANLSFSDETGRQKTLAHFRGQTLLVNFWATWCAPCRDEMPALDRLQHELSGTDFQVIALAVDQGGVAAVRRFYDEVGVRHLPVYVDASGASLQQVNAPGLPTTLLLDRSGREIGRYVGPAKWDDAAAVSIIRNAISQK